MEEVTETPKKTRRRRPSADPDKRYRYKKKPGPKPKGGRKTSSRSKPGTPQWLSYTRSQAAKKRSAEWREQNVARLHEYSKLQSVNPAKYSRLGVPDGMRRAEAEAAWAAARDQAEKVFRHMVEQGIVADLTPDDFERVVVKTADGAQHEVLVPKTDDAKGAIALKEAMVIALSPMTNQQHKLAALKTVLEWTKAKPASTSNVKVTSAEDWLAQVTADANRDAGSESGGG